MNDSQEKNNDPECCREVCESNGSMMEGEKKLHVSSKFSKIDQMQK